MISLKSASKFHGHLGPWLVVGLLMGSYGLKKLKAKKFFGLRIIAKMPNKRPISCLIDGLQLSSGCTLGKGNIRVISAKKINIGFINKENNKSIILGIKKDFLKILSSLKTHNDSEEFAKRIYRMQPGKVIEILGGKI